MSTQCWEVFIPYFSTLGRWVNAGPRASFPEPVSLESGLKCHLREFFQSAGGVPPIDRFWLQKAEASHLCATGFGEHISPIKTQLLRGEGFPLEA